MLTVNQLSRSYGQFKAVDTVSFSVERGEIVGLLGHNGAGKTTIMKMLTGYLEPDQGEVSMNGSSLAADPQRIQKQLGYLPENLPVYGEMVVADYLDYVAEMKQLGESKSAEIKRVVAATEIGDKLLSPISTLSRGFKQRVGVAQALLGDPKLLILDEPTNGLDPTQTEHMRNLIKSIAKQATVILSTHIMQEVDAICDRVLILSNGQLVVDEKLELLRQANHLLLETSLPEKNLNDLLGTNPVLSGIKIESCQSPQSEVFHYKLTPGSGDRRKVAAELAKAVIESGAALYQIQTEKRDLETLFKEVSRQAPAALVTGSTKTQKEKQNAAA